MLKLSEKLNSIVAQRPHTLLDAFKYRAESTPDELVYVWLDDGERRGETATFRQLWERATAIGAELQRRKLQGRSVVLLYSFEGLGFITAFWACIISNVIAVPTYPPDPTRLHRSLGRFELILRDCDCALILTTRDIHAQMAEVSALFPSLKKYELLPTDDIDLALSSSWAEPSIERSDVAFLQYTSGSTGLPKGVMVTHGSLLFNEYAILGHFQVSDHSNACGWLPLYHDMGLIGFVVFGIFGGARIHLMSPISFIKKPFRWLKLISDIRAVVSGAPNFAYELCSRKVTPEMMSQLDLSSLRLLFSGAEPVRPQTVETFLYKFSRCGLSRSAFMPVYGLAEATLLVAGQPLGKNPLVTYFRVAELERGEAVPALCGVAESRALTSCGVNSSGPEYPICIVDPATRHMLPDGRVGEIWVSGPTVAAGYWKREQLSEEIFRARIANSEAGTFLRTGDLGFIYEGNLYVAGREKDLIIIHGRNVYPQDIEATVEKHSLVRPGCCATFSVEVDQEEQLVIVAEVSIAFKASVAKQTIAEIRQSVSNQHELQPHAIVLLKHNTISKTSSGKIQRRASKDLFLKNSLDSVARWCVADDVHRSDAASPAEPTPATTKTEGPAAPVSSSSSSPPPPPASSTTAPPAPRGLSQISDKAQQLVDRIMASISGKLPKGTEVSSAMPFSAYGMSSSDLIGLAGELEEWLGIKLSPTLMYEYPTAELLARHLVDGYIAEVQLDLDAAATAGSAREPLAIVGIGCRFPGATSKDDFWSLLTAGRDAISDIPTSRFDASAFYDPTPRTPGKMYVKSGGFLSDIDLFDSGFFGISKAEAMAMDPQQRVLMTCTQEAFDDAGDTDEALAGTTTAVVVGLCNTDYSSMQLSDPNIESAYAATGGSPSIASNRISYHYDLRGPSVTLDTACSSSLVALDVAGRYISHGCERAVVGGANLILTPQPLIALCQAGFLAPDGRCKPFDESADGFTRSEGVAAIVVKPLSRARAAGGRIYALVQATAVNQDGRSNGLTAPNPSAQQHLLREAYKKAGIDPASVQYIECHGTGTALGDPIETMALESVIGGHGRAAEAPCLIGSVKSNIGHLEACAGLAGLIKLALSIHNRAIPPSIHFSRPNPKIGFDALHLRVVDKLISPWTPAKLIGGVSAFGFGGTNAHAILTSDEAPDLRAPPEDYERFWILALSSDTDSALKATVHQYATWLLDPTSPPIFQICHTALARRTPRKCRAAFLGITKEDLAAQMNLWLTGEEMDAKTKKKSAAGKAMRAPNKTCFVFSGQGPQWYGMGRELYLTNGWFRDRCEEFAALFDKHPLDWDLRDEMSKMSDDESHLDQTKVAQVIIFIFQMCVARLLEHSGVKCSAVIGHSLGEIAAACFAGIIDDETAVKLVFERATLMQQTHGKGKMCAIQLSPEEVAPVLQPFEATTSLACWNAPRSVVISGPEDAVDTCLQRIKDKYEGCHTKMLPVSYVFHSPQLDFAVPALASRLAGMKPAEGRIRMYSTLTGQPVRSSEMGPEYWASQIRKPVLFQTAIAAALKDGHHTMLEISPHPVLLTYIRAAMDAAGIDGLALQTLARKERERSNIANVVMNLWSHGCDVAPIEYMFADDFEEAWTGVDLVAQLPRRVWEPQSIWLSHSPEYCSVDAEPSARLEDCLYDVQFVPQELGLAQASSLAQKRILLFAAPEEARPGFTETLVPLLASAGAEVIAVHLGPAFLQLEPTKIVSSPSADDISAALASSVATGEGISAVVYAWPAASSASDSWTLCMSGLVFLTQALSKAGLGRVPLITVTQGAVATLCNTDTSLESMQATALGCTLTIAREYPEHAPVLVDIAKLSDLPNLAQEVMARIQRTLPSEETCVCLHNGARLVPRAAKLGAPPSSVWVDTTKISPEGTYLVSGGLGGLGLEIARWLCDKGCKSLVLLDKYAATEAAAAKVQALCAREGVEVRVVLASIDDRSAVGDLIREIKCLRGVFHTAGVLQRAAIGQLSADSIAAGLSAKVLGALNLHELTASIPTVDMFVVTSSISSWAPNVGQSVYSAGNAFLNALAHQRQRCGLPALSLCVGLLADVGMIARQNPELLKRVREEGLFATPAADVMQVTAHLLSRKTASALFARVDWTKYVPHESQIFLRFNRRVPQRQKKRRTSAVEEDAEEEEEEDAGFHAPQHTEEEVREWLVRNFSEALGVDHRDLDLEAPLSNYGLQSVTAMDITARLGNWLGHKVSPNIIYDFPTVVSLSKHIASTYLTTRQQQQQQSKTLEMAAPKLESIAVVGMACKFPGGSNGLSAFWDLLVCGRDAITEVPPSRFDVNEFYDPDPLKPNKINSRCGGFVEGIDMFDAEFWSISPREAERLDPQQRMCLEMAWEALEDAGMVPSKLAGGRHGVFVGLSTSDYGQMELLEANGVSDAYFATGSFICMNANRLSYLLDFQGPSVALDTACSSSTVATHLACNALRGGECGIALAGGVNAVLSPTGALALTKTGALSPDGRCFAFDARANGFVRSEGCGMVVLKPLSAAISDRDRVYCVLAGSSVNQDGKSQGLTAPNGVSQQALLKDAYARAEKTLSDVTYIECHGTGTKLGDHIEVESLGRLLLQHRSPSAEKVLLGSVKTNLGHLECASGMASLIKVALSLHKGFIPPSIHFVTPNPHIDFAALPVSVCSEGTSWPEGRPRLAGISSFGFGGTNAHLVLEAAPQTRHAEGKTEEEGCAAVPPMLLPLSARSSQALVDTAKRLAEFLDSPTCPPLRDVSFSLLCRHEHHRLRAAIVCGGSGRTETQARAAAKKDLLEFALAPARHPSLRTAGKVAFVFSGQGPQHFGMARQLYSSEQSFRIAFDRVDKLFRDMPDGFSPVAELLLLEDSSKSRLGETICAQRVLFTLQYALTELYRSRGVLPSVVIGHSLGEIAAAVAAGLLGLSDAVRLVHLRSEVMNRATGLGRMLAIGLSAENCAKLVSETLTPAEAALIAIAAENSPNSCVLSGDAKVLAVLAKSAESKKLLCKFLPVDYAFHSPQIGPLSAELEERLSAFDLMSAAPKQQVTMVSTVTARPVSSEEIKSAGYWAKQIRAGVCFSAAVTKVLVDQLADVFVEIAPHPVLLRYLRETSEHLGLSERCGQTCAMHRDAGDEVSVFMSSLALLYQWHAPVDWSTLFQQDSHIVPAFVSTPNYAWQKQRHWLAAESSGTRLRLSSHRAPRSATASSAASSPILETQVANVAGGETLEWIARVVRPGPLEWEFDHRGFGSVLVPGVTYLEASLEASLQTKGPGLHVLSDIQFNSPLFLSSDQATLHTVLLNTSHHTSTVLVKSPVVEETGANSEGNWIHHATVTLHNSRDQFTGAAGDALPSELDVFEGHEAILRRCATTISGQSYYEGLWARGLQLGPAFRSIKTLHIGDDDVLAELEPPAHLKIEDYVFHPCVLDATMQCLGALLMQQGGGAEEVRGIFLPSHMAALRCWARPPRSKFYVHVARRPSPTKKAIIGDIRAFSESGAPLLQITEFRCNYVEDSRGSDDVYYEQQWQRLEKPASSPEAVASAVVLFSDSRGLGGKIVEACRFADPNVPIFKKGIAELSDVSSFVTFAANSVGNRKLDILFAWPVDAACYDDLVKLALMPLASVVHALGALVATPAANIWVVTADAKAARPGEGQAAWQSAVWGMAGIISHELPQIRVILSDLSAAPSAEEISGLAAEITSGGGSGEDQLCFRAGDVLCCRVSQASAPAETLRVHTKLCDTPCRLEIGKAGSVDSLCLRACQRVPEPKADEVEVAVRAGSINFRDVMRALGLYPAEDDNPALGLEASGVVTRVGRNVSEFHVGDEVVAIANGSLGTHIVTPARFCAHKPRGFTAEQAAALTGVLMTAYAGLVWTAHTERGERVLVHLASGGVGLAALQICKALGCEVFATAGRREKREYLVREMGIPADHVFSSRDVRFADAVSRLTGGKGVDVVLNSLAGEGLLRSYELLAHGGRFVEIGKRDIYSNTQLGMHMFAKCTTVAAVAIDELFARFPDRASQLLHEVVGKMDDGTFVPVPTTAFALQDAAQAFRFVASAAHVGKVVLSVDPARMEADVVVSHKQQALRKNGAYLVSGAFGGMGVRLCEWLIRHGAGTVLALSRAPDAAASEREYLEAVAQKFGARLVAAACDVSDVESLAVVLGRHVTPEAPLCGVFHAAGVLDDKLLADITGETLDRVLRPKVMGALNLHETTKHMRTVDMFVLYSSVASLMGTVGQSAYAAANAFLDGLATLRRARGLPAISLNWGPLRMGMTARQDASVVSAMESQGLALLEPSDYMLHISRVVCAADPSLLPSQLALLKVDWAKWAASASGALTMARTKRFSGLARSSGAQTISGRRFLRELFALSSEGTERISLVTNRVAAVVASVLSLPLERVDTARPLSEAGLDSMVANEVRVKLEQDIGIPVSVASLIGGPPITKVAAALLSQLEALGAEKGAAASAEPHQQPSLAVELAQGRAPTVLAVCPAGGQATIFGPLSSCLGRRFLALQRASGPCAGLGELAAAHLDSVLKLVPAASEGFTVVGHSLGAVVGLELALQLCAKGVSVDALVLLDPVSAETQRALSTRGALRAAMMLFAIGRGNCDPEALASALEWDVAQQLDSPGKDKDKDEDRLWERFFDALSVQAPERSAHKLAVNGVAEEIAMFSRYTWPSATPPFPVFIVRATGNHARTTAMLQTTKAPSSWASALGVSQIPTFETPGDHWTMLSIPENAASVAAAISKALP